MTCIIALKEKGKIYMGADCAGVVGWNTFSRSDKKIMIKNNLIMGVTGSYRLIDLLNFELSIPSNKSKMDARKFISKVFVKSLRRCLKSGGLLKIHDEVESMPGSIAIGFENRIFEISEDFQVGEPTANFLSIGCANLIALGAMEGLSYTRCLAPKDKIMESLKIASVYDGVVKPPFSILCI